ncbi:MAG: hypothetical protein WC503_05380 [Candidatus Shapirobacteria bacterium]
MNKKQLWGLVVKSQLSEASMSLIKENLKNFEDNKEMGIDKLKTVSNILEAEEKINQALSDNCDKIIKELEKFN